MYCKQLNKDASKKIKFSSNKVTPLKQENKMNENNGAPKIQLADPNTQKITYRLPQSFVAKNATNTQVLFLCSYLFPFLFRSFPASLNIFFH